MNQKQYKRANFRRKKSESFPYYLIVFILSILAAGGAFGQDVREAKDAGNPPAAKKEAKKELVSKAAATATAPIGLSDYLGQVSEKHLGFKAADKAARGARLEAGEGALLFEPSFIVNGAASADAQTNPFASNDKQKVRNYSVGLAQNSRFGLGAQVTYKRTELDYPLLPAPYPSPFNFTTDWVQLDLTQSLSRNWLGRETAAQSQLAESGALAKAFNQSFVTKQILLEAESNYWRLALAREMVAMQKDAVERAQRIFDWTSRRVKLQLADRAELLQGSTNLQARKLDWRTAEDEERAAAQAFNSSRGLLADKVGETLQPLTPELIASFNIPERTVRRDDVQAAEQNAKATAASATLSLERNKPTVEVFASVPVTQPTTAVTAQTASLVPTTMRPSTLIGLRATVPLDLATLSKAREGYAAEAASADINYQRKTFEEERDWADLTAKFIQAKDRLKLYTELEKVQREKLVYERDRQQRGRSTLQQVLLFETDYEQAQLGRIRTLADLLTLNAQMKLYGVSYESR